MNKKTLSKTKIHLVFIRGKQTNKKLTKHNIKQNENKGKNTDAHTKSNQTKIKRKIFVSFGKNTSSHKSAQFLLL